MTTHQPSGRSSLTRRSALGLIGGVPLAASGLLALSHNAQASTPATDTGHTATGSVPSGFCPGGAFDRYVSGLAAQDEFSGTVLVGWHGRPILVRSYHDADTARHIPNRADTIYPLDSVTKFLTGVAVTQLAARGKIDFYATLGTYLAGFQADIADHITVHQLLTHTSGFPASLQATREDWKTRTEAFNGMLALLRQQKLATTPGTTYAYSNANYFLAGAIIAAASGEHLWDYMPRHIFGPAGLTSTASYTNHQWLTDPRFAHVYGSAIDGQRQDVTTNAINGPNGWDGASGIFSTAPDLLRFATALTDGTLLPTAWETLRAGGKYPVNPANNDPDAPNTAPDFMISYGSDERISSSGQRAYGHTGGLHIHVDGSSQPGGTNTALTLYPDLDLVAVVLCNYSLAGVGGISAILAQQDRAITQHDS